MNSVETEKSLDVTKMKTQSSSSDSSDSSESNNSDEGNATVATLTSAVSMFLLPDLLSSPRAGSPSAEEQDLQQRPQEAAAVAR